MDAFDTFTLSYSAVGSSSGVCYGCPAASHSVASANAADVCYRRHDALPLTSLPPPPPPPPLPPPPSPPSPPPSPSRSMRKLATMASAYAPMLLASRARCDPGAPQYCDPPWVCQGWIAQAGLVAHSSDPAVCLRAVLANPLCSDAYFNHASDGNCGCVTPGADCDAASHQARGDWYTDQVSIYRIVAATLSPPSRTPTLPPRPPPPPPRPSPPPPAPPPPPPLEYVWEEGCTCTGARVWLGKNLPWGVEASSGRGFLECEALAAAYPSPFATFSLSYSAAGGSGVCYGCPSLFTTKSSNQFDSARGAPTLGLALLPPLPSRKPYPLPSPQSPHVTAPTSTSASASASAFLYPASPLCRLPPSLSLTHTHTLPLFSLPLFTH